MKSLDRFHLKDHRKWFYIIFVSSLRYNIEDDDWIGVFKLELTIKEIEENLQP